jgi:cytochrome c oxidase cbb3-type subunit 3
MTDDRESERLLDHAYDGIQEYDNPLPRWWVWIFYATIVFSVLYAVDVGGWMKGPGRVPAYEHEMADAARRWPVETGTGDTAALATAARDPATIASGRAAFATNCAVCHRADGGGLIGPNLADDYWIHGGSLAEIQRTIADGVLAKGMPNWGKLLRPEQVRALTAYVASLQGTSPKDGKAPEGVRAGGDGPDR